MDKRPTDLPEKTFFPFPCPEVNIIILLKLTKIHSVKDIFQPPGSRAHVQQLLSNTCIQNRYKIYTLHHYNIIYNTGRAALEQAYRNLCKLGSNYIHIHLCTKSISIKR